MPAGILSKIAFGLESTWGTGVVPDKALAVKPGDGIQTDNDVQFIEGIKGQLAKNSGSFKGAVNHEGGYEFDLIPGNAGYILKSLFGGLAGVEKGGDSGVYDHTFTENAVHPSLTIQQDVVEIRRRFAGCIVTALTLSQNVAEPLSANATIKAKSSTAESAVSPANETINPFNFAHLLQANGFTIGGTAFDEVESLEIEYRNNIEFLHSLGENNPSFHYANATEVIGKVEMYLNSDTAAKYADFFNQTERAIVARWTGAGIGTTSNYGLLVTIPRAVFTASTSPVSDDYTKLSLEFEGMYDTGSSKLIDVVLTNLTANYN